MNVKNSPLYPFATLTGKLLYCRKFGCPAASAGLKLVGKSFMIDNILEARNQEKVFTPLIAKGVKFIVNGRPAKDILNGINKDIKKLDYTKIKSNEISDLFNKANNSLDYHPSDFSKEDLDTIKSTIE